VIDWMAWTKQIERVLFHLFYVVGLKIGSHDSISAKWCAGWTKQTDDSAASRTRRRHGGLNGARLTGATGRGGRIFSVQNSEAITRILTRAKLGGGRLLSG
jgi:hypothetical protein